ARKQAPKSSTGRDFHASGSSALGLEVSELIIRTVDAVAIFFPPTRPLAEGKDRPRRVLTRINARVVGPVIVWRTSCRTAFGFCYLPVRGIMSCKESAHGRAAQPGCSTQALRRSRRARGGRSSPADGWAKRGAGPRAGVGSGVHRRADPAPPL